MKKKINLMNIPNLYKFATKELAQDATIAYILAWADPAYRKSHTQLHQLGTELLRSLLDTQEVSLPPIKTLCIETQVNRIDILVRINTDQDINRIILIIEDKVSTNERLDQIKNHKKKVKEKYAGKYDQIAAVYLKTGNGSKAYLPSEKKCGRFLRRDLLKILDMNMFQDTGNEIIENFYIHLQRWENDTNAWKVKSYDKWEWRQWEGFYMALEEKWDSKWGYVANPSGGFLSWWGGVKKIEEGELYLQIHNGTRLTVRVSRAGGVRSPFMWEVLNILKQVNISNDIQIEKAGRFRGGGAAAVANVTFDNQNSWLPTDVEKVVDLEAAVERLDRVDELLQEAAKQIN